MDILDDMRVSKLSAKVFFKVNYSFKTGVMMLKILNKYSLGQHKRFPSKAFLRNYLIKTYE